MKLGRFGQIRNRWKARNVVRRMDKISWTDHVRSEEVLLRVKEQRNILHEISKRKANWIGHILCRNCLLQQDIEEKIKWGIKVTGRWGRRRRKPLGDLKERRGYSHLKEKALDRTMWRAGFRRSLGPVVRQTTKWMNHCSYIFWIVTVSHIKSLLSMVKCIQTTPHKTSLVLEVRTVHYRDLPA